MRGAAPVRANAASLPLADESVDLIVTSPPYFALRSYRDGGQHYDGQVGSEPTPQAFLDALWEVTKECWRVLKPTGSLFVNLGDKRAGTGGANGNTGLGLTDAKEGAVDPRTGPRNNTKQTSNAVFNHAVGLPGLGRQMVPERTKAYRGVRPKSKMLLPHRYAIGCEDGLADPDGVGWIVRQDIVWSKPNGLPESVTDRVRDSHEFWFHLTKQGRYFSAVDEVREPHNPASVERNKYGRNGHQPTEYTDVTRGVLREGTPKGLEPNPLGKIPGSVWTIASEPLTLPDAVKAHHDLPDHFAAFPQEWPRRLILGWSPSGVCVACGEGRRPVVAKTGRRVSSNRDPARQELMDGERHAYDGRTAQNSPDAGSVEVQQRMKGGPSFLRNETEITGYACACPDTSAPTRPAVVADVFGGTGTVAGVARQLGRLGLSFDLSYDYCRLAQWFLRDGRRFAKSASRTDAERQGSLL